MHKFATGADRTSSIIKAVSQWHAMPGCLFGVRQPTLAGSIRIAQAGALDWVALDAAIKALLEELDWEAQPDTGTQGLAERLARLVVKVQMLYGIPLTEQSWVGRGKREPGSGTIHEMALPCHSPEGSRLALNWAISALNGLLASGCDNKAIDTASASLAQLHLQLKPFSVQGTNVLHFVRAAGQLGIPVTRLLDNYFSFGTGCHSRWLQSTFTDRTSAMGIQIARNKAATALLLRRSGLPAPQQVLATSTEEALAAAERLGMPVVVKPVDQEQGRGVFANLRDGLAVQEAATAALKFSGQAIVERHHPGKDYRLTVFEGEVVKVELRLPANVIGDGQHTIAELTAAKQASPHYRKILRKSGKVLLSLDAEALGLLAEAGLQPGSVPEAGRFVQLRRKSNVSTGGDQVAVSVDEVHPDNRQLAARAAAALRLDFAGIDLLIGDIAGSWLETGALICEVNAMPQIGVRTSPYIYSQILLKMLGPVSRIPAHLILTGEKTLPFTKMVRLADDLSCNGIADVAGVWIDGQRIATRADDGFTAARTLLGEQAARSALCIMPFAEFKKKGLPCDWFDSIRLHSLPQEGRWMDALRPHCGKLLLGSLLI